MSIYLSLFLTFLEIGAVSFGGGYGMIALIQEKVIGNGWLTESEVLNFIAVSESTPGPIAINMATFIGSSQGGILGSCLATVGVILPSIIIILIISAVIKNLLKLKGVQAFLSGVRPAVIGLIIATGTTMFLTVFFSLKTVSSTFSFEWEYLIIFAIITLIGVLYKKKFKRAFSPILLILISGALGIIVNIL